MANEFVHGSVGTELTQAEWEGVGTHVFNSQATGDIVYASSSSQLSRLAKGTDTHVLILSSGIPAWSTSTGITALGTIATGVWQGTDVGVAYGGTGVSTLTDGGILLGSGGSAITAMAVLTDGQMIVGDGTTDPVAESGATLRTSIGVGTGNSPQFTDLTLTDDLSLNSDSAVLNMGDGDDFTITHDGTTGATLAGNPITITSAGAATWSTGAGVLTIDGDDGIILNTTGSGDLQINENVLVGADTDGYDVKFFGDTTGRYMLWDESDDSLILPDATLLKFGDLPDVSMYFDTSNMLVKANGANTTTDFWFSGDYGTTSYHGLIIDNTNGQGYGSGLTFRGNNSGAYDFGRIWLESGTNGATMFFQTANSSNTLVTGLEIDKAQKAKFYGDVNLNNNDLLNVGASGNDFDTSGITVASSADSSAAADQVTFGRYEIGAGNTVIALSQETVVASDTDETKFSHKLQVRINGSTYYIMLTNS